MAEGGEDKEQKTEEPTAKRLEEAFKRGQVPFSREVSSFLMLFVLALTIAWFMPDMLRRARDVLVMFLARAGDMPVDRRSLGPLLWELMWHSIGIVILPLLLAVGVALAASLAQNGVVFSDEPIKPKWNKISPMAGLKRIFSVRSVVEFTKNLIKIIIVGIIGYMAVSGQLMHMRQLSSSDLLALLIFLSDVAVRLMVGVCVAMFFIALFDLIYQRISFMRSMRMSKQEIKDEYKQQEGDPQIKQRLRRIRMERARKRMMAEVPKADVVITNPTHFAVALKYEMGKLTAPVVVAKAQDNMALQIRKIAKENDVPIVENPPLARALYDAVEIDEQIPLEHYQAVAEIISYVWRLKGKLPPRQQSQQQQRR